MFSSLHILRQGIIVVQFTVPLQLHASSSLSNSRLCTHCVLAPVLSCCLQSMLPLLQLQPLLRVLIHHVSNTNGRDHLQQIRSQSFEQSSHALALDRLSRDIHNARVRPRMTDSALTLQSRSKQVEWIHDASAKCTTETSHQCQTEVIGLRVLIVLYARVSSSVSPDDSLFQRVEDVEIDGRIWEHPD